MEQDKSIKKYMEKVKKRVCDRSKNFYLYVYSFIKEGFTPSQIAIKFNKSKQLISYYIKVLKANGLIEKLSYGVWKTTNVDIKEVKIITLSGSSTHRGIFTSQFISRPKKNIRSHGYRFTLRLKYLKNWDKREDYLKSKGINFNKLKGLGNKLKLIIDGYTAWLNDTSIIIIFPKHKSYFTETGESGNNYAILDFLRIIKRIEGLLGNIDLSIKGKYEFKPFLQHHALIKNELAKIYDKQNKKLFVYNEKGLWLLIDNSFNLHELETVSPITATKNMDNMVAPYFNDLESNDHFLPSETKAIIGKILDQNMFLAKEIQTHLLVVNEVKILIPALTDLIKILKEKEGNQ